MSEIIRVWVYKTQWELKKKYLVSQLISIRSLSKYAHIEIEDVVNGKCYTSTMRDDNAGTVCRDSAIVLRHPSHWDCIEIEVDPREYGILFWWLNKKVAANKGYGKWDINKFLSPIHFADNLRDICSELVNNGLVIIRLIDGFGIVLPVTVVKKLVKKGYKIIDGREILRK